LLNSITEAALLMKADGTVLAANATAANRLDRRGNDIVGLNIYSLLPDGVADLRKKMVDKAITTGQAVKFDDVRQGRYIGNSIYPVASLSGVIDRVAIFGIDLTERKQAEEALIVSESSISKKLNAILEPEGDIGSLELSDILDYRSIQLMMDDFYSLSGIGVAIADTQGKILVATGWQDICTQFHRVNPETQKYCRESDVTLTSDAAPGQVKLYKCKNNMWDVATPIYLGEKHMGNVFYGQFFFTDEMPDYDLFRQQARRHGFDEQAYIAALDRANRWDRDKIDLIMTFYARFATMISQLSYSAIKLSRLLAENDKTLASLKESEEQFRFLVNYSYDLIWRLKPDGVFSYVSPSWITILGYEPSYVVGRAFQPFVHPDDVEECEKYMARVMDAKKPLPGQQYRVRHSNGTWQWHETSMSPVLGNDGSLMYFVGVSRDITERKQAEEALRLSEGKYRSLFEQSIAVVYAFDRKKNFIDTNQAGLDLVGYSREELLAMHISDVDVDYEAILPAQQNILSEARSTTSNTGCDGRTVLLSRC
jgi:PAS domain S-box-containing protein